MKARHGILLAVVFSASLAGGSWTWRHFHPLPLPYFTQDVRIEDVRATVTALGQVDGSRGSIEAAVPEADVFKLRAGQSIAYNLVAIPDQTFEGAVSDVRIIPIGVPQPDAVEAPKKDANGDPLPTDTDGVPIDPDTGVRMEAKAVKPNRDAYSSGKDGVFYRVLFDMGSAAGRFPVGMSVTVHVILGVAKQVPTVPVMALGRVIGDNRYEIEVIGADGKPQTREITTGLTDNLSMEVKSGVKPGDTIVIRETPNLYEPGFRG